MLARSYARLPDNTVRLPSPIGYQPVEHFHVTPGPYSMRSDGPEHFHTDPTYLWSSSHYRLCLYSISHCHFHSTFKYISHIFP
jgi:hypothetical protein